MKKRILSFVLVLSLISNLIISFPITANAETIASGTCGENVTWELNYEGTLTIKGTGAMYNYNSSSEPAWYSFTSQINSLAIEEGITSIASCGFCYLKIQSLNIPDTVTNIETGAFAGSNIKTLNIGNSVVNIGNYAFQDCKELEKVSLPNSCIDIGYYAFMDCDALEKITIPNGVKNINYSAFAYCDSLKEVNIPSSVETLGSPSPFVGCKNLAVINVDSNNQKYVSINGSLYTKDKTKLLQIAIGGEDYTYTVLDTVKEIFPYAFAFSTKIESINLGQNLENVGWYSFYECSSLKQIYLGNKISNIGSYAFENCNALSEIYYNGDIDDWGKINISDYNTNFTDANIHYNYVIATDSPIEIGDYVQMGTYYGKPILWRCVAFEKITGYDNNGNPIMDATDTVTEYQDGYLPLLLSDGIISVMAFDTNGTGGSHSRENSRIENGSNYWGDSNIRSWLNSSTTDVSWLCGNPPVSCWPNAVSYENQKGFLKSFSYSEVNAIQPVTQKCIVSKAEYENNIYDSGTSAFLGQGTPESVSDGYENAYSIQLMDKIFLLDVKQLNSIYANKHILGDDYYIGKISSQVANNKSNFSKESFIEGQSCYYWLRTPDWYYDNFSYGGVVSTTGYVQFNCVSAVSYGIRPALFLKASIELDGNGTLNQPYTVSNLLTSTSNSTSPDAPIIKSAKLQYDGKTYDIINQSVDIGKNSGAIGNIVLDIDWKDVTVANRSVYITQGASTKNDLVFGEYGYDYLIDTFTNFNLGKDFQADKPIYIIAMDKSNPEVKSTSIVTKLNILDLSTDDVYQESLTGDFNFKLGKDTEIQLPDDVPIIGGMKLSCKMSPIPITVAYKSADAMSLAIGCNVVTENKDGIKKFKDFDFDKYKKSIIDAEKKQGRTLKQLRHDFRLSNDIKVSMFDDKILSGGSGDVDSGVDVLGYAEVKRGKDGKWKFDEAMGYIKVDVSVSYTYNGQVFVWVIPCYYEIGGELSAGFEADIESLDKASYAPQLTAYLNAALGINLGAGIGVPKVATFGATGSGTLNLKKGLSDVLENYIRIWLEVDAGYKLSVFGKTLVSDDLWKLSADKGIIYSTDPEDEGKTWIKSEPIALMSLEQTYNAYNAAAIYENESRQYLSNPTEWYGDMPPISLFATDYTNKNLTILADSVYPEAQPQIFSVNGKKILVFTADNKNRTADNKQMLVYSVYNDEAGTWSKAVPVNDDGTADFYPSVCGEYLVWQNQKSVMNDGLSLAEIGKQGEIVIAKWNGNGFDAPISLTDNNALDTLPKVGVNGNEISVVWLKNTANDILGIDGDTSIVKKVYDGSAWGEELVLKDNLNAVTDLSVGYYENTLNVAYVHDTDDDMATIDDREIFLIGSSEKQITDNEVLDSNAIINNGKLYWYSENNIHFMNLADGTKSMVFEDARYALADGFTVSEDNGNIAILWSASEDESSEIKGVLYQNGAWGDVITVSELGAYAKYPTCVLEEDGTILTSFTAEADGITSLYTLGLFPSYDLAISDIYFDEKNLALNSENAFEVMVTNAGELPVEGYTLNAYNEDGTLNNRIVFEDTIKAGESKTVVGKFITGDTISYETLKIEIALNEDEEYVYDNNSVTLSVGNGDISLESLSVYEMLPTSYVVADVKNIGYSDISNITVNLRKYSVDGEIVQSKTVSSLATASNEEVTFAYKPADYENVKWYITVETEADEVSVGNNYDYFINECSVDLEDYEISILNYSYADKQLTVNAFAKNNTNKALTVDAIFAVYSSDGRFKGITTQHLSVGGYSDTGIDVWFENYTYASGDYVRMFVWSDLTVLKPLVNAEQVNIIVE